MKVYVVTEYTPTDYDGNGETRIIGVTLDKSKAEAEAEKWGRSFEEFEMEEMK